MDSTLLMVEADHGGTPGGEGHGGGHGGDTDAEKYVFFAAAGGNVCHTELRDMIVRDTAPAILHALGVPQPESWTGRVPCGMFPDKPGLYARPRGDESAAALPAFLPETGAFAREFADFAPLAYETMEAVDPARARGKLYAVPGRAGNAVRFDDGCMVLPCPELDAGFSLCCWVRLESAARDAFLFATRLMGDGAEAAPGFALRAAGDYLHLLIAAGDAPRVECCELPRPRDMIGRWCFLALALDARTGEARFSVDFEPFLRWTLPIERPLRPGGGMLYLGGDESSARLPAALDDLCLCRRLLTDGDLARLRRYYRA